MKCGWVVPLMVTLADCASRYDAAEPAEVPAAPTPMTSAGAAVTHGAGVHVPDDPAACVEEVPPGETTLAGNHRFEAALEKLGHCTRTLKKPGYVRVAVSFPANQKNVVTIVTIVYPLVFEPG